MEKIKRALFFAIFMVVIVGVFTLLIMTVDVQAIGPLGSKVGFASLNKAFFDTFGQNEVFYKISELVGYLSITMAASFAMIGLIQLIKGRSFKKVSLSIYALGLLYLILFILYVLFLKTIVINYRPVLEAGVLESSFPSSHTILTCTIMGSTYIMLGRVFKKEHAVRIGLRIGCVALLVIMVVSRLFSGVHWFTDVIGSVIYSAALLSIFQWLLAIVDKIISSAKH